jgi:protein arginine kinase activator
MARCDRCGAAENLIHLTQVIDNEVRSSHLCQACAEAQGLATPHASAPEPLLEFLAQLAKEPQPEHATVAGACPSCGLTPAELKRTGRLGCAMCYAHFGGQLRALLRQLHGVTQHRGKGVFVARERAVMRRTAQIVGLRRSLQQAIEGEDFERAAGLRDELRRVEALDQEAGR